VAGAGLTQDAVFCPLYATRCPLIPESSNLRLATHSQNTCNKQNKRAGCSSQYRGVSFDRKRKYWNVQVVLEGKYVFFGRYKSEIEAAKAYDEAARKYHGEFARLNFPESADSVQRAAYRTESKDARPQT